jgi:deazaflavin-dependent oxidoreductase (nitroreductase family)
MRGNPTLLLTTTGRRSGRPHTVPLPYLADGDAMIVIGSASGADRHPAWVLNLIANPRVTVQYLADSGPAQAEILADGERKAMWERINAEAPWYTGYQQRTSREIPLIRLTRTQPAHSLRRCGPRLRSARPGWPLPAGVLIAAGRRMRPRPVTSSPPCFRFTRESTAPSARRRGRLPWSSRVRRV